MVLIILQSSHTDSQKNNFLVLGEGSTCESLVQQKKN